MSADPATNAVSAEDAAVQWFNRKRAGDMSADDARALDVWLSQAPGHRTAYEELERQWEVFGLVVDDPAIMSSRERNAKALSGGSRLRATGAVAAGLVVVCAGGWGLMRAGVLSEIALFAPAPQELRTSLGQRTTVTLPDKSIVTLDTDTVLRIRETWRERRIELERGQAFFQVAKDRSRPFIVAASGKTVRATGTAFDVRAENGNLQVTLIEGRVRVEEQDKQPDAPVADMRPGWRLAIGEDKHWRIQPVDIEKETSWHDGQLTFFHDPLDVAVAEMNRYSRRKIVFAGVAPKAPVVGVFAAGDVENFVHAVEMNKLARVTSETEDRIELSAR